MKTLRFALPLLLVISACSSFDEPDFQVLALTQINEEPLPGPFPWMEHVRVTSGSLTLHDDGRVVLETVIRCKDDLPQNVSCEVEGDGRLSGNGTYFPGESLVRFAAGQWPADAEYFVEVETNVVRITFSKPASTGYHASYSFEYRR